MLSLGKILLISSAFKMIESLDNLEMKNLLIYNKHDHKMICFDSLSTFLVDSFLLKPVQLS